jgi:hypothetical protein
MPTSLKKVGVSEKNCVRVAGVDQRPAPEAVANDDHRLTRTSRVWHARLHFILAL